MAASDAAAYDVYAKPFVPGWLQFINDTKELQLFKSTVTPEDSVDIDYGAYVQGFTGTSLLQPNSKPGPRDSTRNDENPVRIVEEGATGILNYGDVYSRVVDSEYAALELAQKDFNIYQSTLTFVKGISADEKICIGSFRIPGVAEHSPLIRVGDILNLRQVLVMNNGQPYQWHTVAKNGLYSRKDYPCAGWNGLAFEAIVVSVKLATEDVFLCIRGPISPPQAGDPMPQFNITFPVREDWITSLKTSVNTITRSLCISPSTGTINAIQGT
jgi:hypothetical protein